MLGFLFGYIKDVICTATIALSLFIAGIVYGDAPIDIKFTYDIPTQVYEYEVGDKVEVNVTAENVGRPFMGVTFVAHGPEIEAKVFKNDEDGKVNCIYYNQEDYNKGEILTDDADVEGYIKKDIKSTQRIGLQYPKMQKKVNTV